MCDAEARFHTPEEKMRITLLPSRIRTRVHSMFSWWSSLDAVIRFNVWVQWSLAIFGGLTFIALVLVAMTSKQIGFLQDRETQRAQEESRRLQERLQTTQRELEETKKRLAPRALTPDRLGVFLGILRQGPKGTVDLQYVANFEAETFCAEIANALRTAGWDAHITSALVMVEGIQGLATKGRDMNRMPAHAVVLKTALAQIGFPVADAPADPNIPEGIVQLIVGEKP
jgi:hypothetical protein